jgi:hypothetical protein
MKNLKEAVQMKNIQKDNFAEFDRKFPPEVTRKWEETVEAWEHNKSATNPYEETPVCKHFILSSGAAFLQCHSYIASRGSASASYRGRSDFELRRNTA